ncbi:MAG: DUF72 domain-containing protein [Pseudomonadota bacterium]
MSESLTLPGFDSAADASSVKAVSPTPARGESIGQSSPRLFIGTSSWSFPGWNGIVFDGAYTQAQLARDGLRAYAAHPALNTVSIDRTFYRSVPAEAFDEYRRSVDADFRFVVKADRLCTTAADERGGVNERFLNPEFARRHVIGPALDGLRDQLGALVFQFPPQRLDAAGGAHWFFARLNDFFAALPVGPTYAIEFRDRGWLTADYRKVLESQTVRHCISIHPRMPTARTQWRFASATHGPTIVRWNLGHGLGYARAKSLYAPFDRLAAPDEPTRRELAHICTRSIAFDYPAFVTINNKAEGSAPLSAMALREAIDAVNDQHHPNNQSSERGSAHERQYPR